MQSWGRLCLLGLLLLIAQSIVADLLFPKGHNIKIHHATGHKAVVETGNSTDGINLSDDNGELHVGWDGIVIRNTPKGDSDRRHGGAAPGPAPGAPAPPTAAPDAAPAVPAPPAAAPGSVTPAPAMPLTAANKSSANDDDDEGDDDTIVITPPMGIGGSAREVAENLAWLFIVFLIAAKIVLRKTAQSEARATEAMAVAERESLQYQVALAQLQALQAQVEPHFLFNTLASVDYLIESDPARASAMQKLLIQYLRSALPQMRDGQSNLGRELDLARAYLEILKMRMEDRLNLVYNVPEGLRSAEFPPMMLQSLVENAIQHGVEPKAEGGEVRITAAVVDGVLEVQVADTGIGIRRGETRATAPGQGLGLRNIQERLALLYPGRASFRLEPQAPSGAVSTIRLPYRVNIAPAAAPAGARPAGVPSGRDSGNVDPGAAARPAV